MLYLCELNKPNFGKPSLQPLAKQPQPDFWQPVNEEAIQLDGKITQELGKLKDGSLVLAEVIAGRQVSRVNEASKQLVSYLHNYARLQEKTKSQEEEVQTWRRSLSFQATELNRREMEIESREEELVQLHQQYESVAAEMQTLEAKRAEITTQESYIAEQQRVIGQQREELNRQRAELEGLLQQAQQGRLSQEEADQLRHFVAQLQQDQQSGSDPLLQLRALQEQIYQHQQEQEQVLRDLQGSRQDLQRQQDELDQALHGWQQRRHEHQQARAALEQARAELHAQETSRKQWQEQLQHVGIQILSQEDLYQKAHRLVREHDFVVAGDNIPREALVSVEDLTQQVQELRGEYEQRSTQVKQQEAELEQNRQNLEDLRQRLSKASASDRLDIEMDIDYAQAACGALEETLQPQQDNLQRVYAALVAQETRLTQLQAGSAATSVPSVDLGPVLAQIDVVKQQQEQERQRLELQLQQLEANLHRQQEILGQQQRHLDQQGHELEQEDGSLRERLRAMAEAWGRFNVQQERLSQELERLGHLQHSAEQLAEILVQQAEVDANAQSHLQSLQSIIANLTQSAQ